MMAETQEQPKRVFISHSGRDKFVVTEMAELVRTILARRGIRAEVFNTSDSEHRFRDRSSGETEDEWEQNLKAYLQKNLDESDLYILAFTPTTFSRVSDWVRFEFHVADELSTVEHIAFLPCVMHGFVRKDMEFEEKHPDWLLIDEEFERRLLFYQLVHINASRVHPTSVRTSRVSSPKFQWPPSGAELEQSYGLLQDDGYREFSAMLGNILGS